MDVVARDRRSGLSLQKRRGIGFAALFPMLFSLAATTTVSAVATASAYSQTAAKTIEGKAFDGGTSPLPGAIIYLQDQKTNVVKTFIATADGSYRFGQLPADTDYKIWARFKDAKSKDRLISSFDPKLNLTIDFHVGSK